MRARLLPLAPPPVDRQAADAVWAAEQERLLQRRANYFHIERMSLSERSFFPVDFDPGQDYDTL